MASTLDTYVSPVLVASGTTFAQLQAGGLPVMVAAMLAANPAVINPTVAATATATGGGASGGLLAAGDYFFAYTWVTALGETTAGTAFASEVTGAVTVGTANKPRVTIPALPTGVTSANIYATAAAGLSGTETLYATGITTTTFDLIFAAGSDPLATLPTSNTTGGTTVANLLNTFLTLPNPLRQSVDDMLTSWLRGDPISRASMRVKHKHRAAALKVLQAVMDEIGVLIKANPGTLGAVLNAGTGNTSTARTWS